MDFVSAIQVEHAVLNEIEFDLIIVASGYEKRSSYLPENFQLKARQKLAIAYKEKNKELFREQNDQILSNHNFQLIEASSQNPKAVFPVILNMIDDYKGKEINILIDYSCMTKIVYAGIIDILLSDESKLSRANVYFSYTPSKFFKPARYKNIRKTHSVTFPNKLKVDNKPVALLIGLGVEKLRAKTLYNKVNPEELILMYADPSFDRKYVELVFENNQDIIKITKSRNLINYPLFDIDKTSEILTNLCLDLRMKYNVILAPLGPKIFALNCLLHSVKFPDIDVWRVSAGKKEPSYNKQAQGHPLILKTVFELEDDE